MRGVGLAAIWGLCALGALAEAAPGGFAGVYVPASRDRPAAVEGVAAGSPAARAGLRVGDRVVAVDGVPLRHGLALAELLERAYPERRFRLQVRRGAELLQAELTLSTWSAFYRAQEKQQKAPARKPAPPPAPAREPAKVRPKQGWKAHPKPPQGTRLSVRLQRAPFVPGQDVILAGRRVPIGAPVVTWQDRAGYDGYATRCAFSPQALPRRPAAGCNTPRRYGARRGLDPALLKVVGQRGWTPALAALAIDQVVIHYDVAWTSRNCFKVLHDLRGLSCHFLLDVDGTLYQTLDLVERARHAGKANSRSIGIEIAHPGPLELTRGLARRYRLPAGAPQGSAPRFDLGRLRRGLRLRDFPVIPARPQPIRGRIQGRVYTQYDFTAAQYRTLARLLAGLNRALPQVRLAVPRDARGQVRDAVLSAAELKAHQGLVGHYHVSARKQDPGPAFDWAGLLQEARRLRAQR